MKRALPLTILIISLLLSSCGTPSPDVTPTSIPQPTETPLSLDLQVQVTDSDGNNIQNAVVSISKVDAVQSTDSNGITIWNGLTTNEVFIEVTAQGYFVVKQNANLDTGENAITVPLERDPFGLLPAEVIPEGEELVYIEDFQDGNVDLSQVTGDWHIIEDEENPGNSLLQVDQKNAENYAMVIFGPENDIPNFSIQYRFQYKNLEHKEETFISLSFRENYNLSNDPFGATYLILDLNDWSYV